MKKYYNLNQLNWVLAGCTPHQWQLNPFSDINEIPALETDPIPAAVPGSVQNALRLAGKLPDWNQGLNAPLCEWVENRHWLFQTEIPGRWLGKEKTVRLVCQGLDDRGWILVNGKILSRFENGFVPHEVELSQVLIEGNNLLQIIFDVPARWLGQFGYTSQMTDWKARFYYTWDWVSRLVQIGVWDVITLEVSDGLEIQNTKPKTTYDPVSQIGKLYVEGKVNALPGWRVSIELTHAGEKIFFQEKDCENFNLEGCSSDGLDISAWYPAGCGDQPLYHLEITLIDNQGNLIDKKERIIGFRSIEWTQCQDAPQDADPWICVVNGKSLFLQGFNWTPIRPNFADVTDSEYRKRLELYRDLGVNVLRVWGGAVLEKEIFYQLCDELGILVWQDFPLSSSGVDNWPPEDETSIEALSFTAKSYIARRQHHVSLLCWCGGNELQGDLQGGKIGIGKPVDLSHPLIKRFADIVAEEDEGRRFLVTTSSGPRFYINPDDIGKGLHWDVHGPWKLPAGMEEWRSYWDKVDALFHSEVGAPGCSPVNIISSFSGGMELMPASIANPYWRRTSWWIEWEEFSQEMGREAGSLQEFVEWSQNRQAQALAIVANALKSKFPRCGGVIFWMGHDCFPCTANTAVIDFHGEPKPAALALGEIFRRG